MLDEFRFAVKCGASRQRPVLRRSCSNCSLSKSGKTALPISRIHEFNSPTATDNFLPHSKLSNLNSLSNGNLRLISSNENAGSFPSHLHHSHQFLHQPHHYAPYGGQPLLHHHQLMHQNSNLSSSNHQLQPYRSHSKATNFKNYKFSSFNNHPDSYCRPLNSDLYSGLPPMPYSLQNLLLLDPTGAHHHAGGDESGAFNNGDSSNIPTPPLPPDRTHRLLNQSSVGGGGDLIGQSNLKPTLVKQRSLAAIDLDQYTDAHFQHHLETLAHQFNQQLHGSSRQLESGNPLLHRTLSNDDNFDKCNLMEAAAGENADRNAELISQPDDLLFTSQEYPDLDAQYRIEDNQPH